MLVTLHIFSREGGCQHRTFSGRQRWLRVVQIRDETTSPAVTARKAAKRKHLTQAAASSTSIAAQRLPMPAMPRLQPWAPDETASTAALPVPQLRSGRHPACAHTILEKNYILDEYVFNYTSFPMGIRHDCTSIEHAEHNTLSSSKQSYPVCLAEQTAEIRASPMKVGFQLEQTGPAPAASLSDQRRAGW